MGDQFKGSCRWMSRIALPHDGLTYALCGELHVVSPVCDVAAGHERQVPKRRRLVDVAVPRRKSLTQIVLSARVVGELGPHDRPEGECSRERVGLDPPERGHRVVELRPGERSISNV